MEAKQPRQVVVSIWGVGSQVRVSLSLFLSIFSDKGRLFLQEDVLLQIHANLVLCRNN